MNDLGNPSKQDDGTAGERLEIRVLGPLRLEIASPEALGQRVPCSGKEATFVAYLAITGREHSRESLAELFWPERSPDQSLGNLRVLLSRLRKKLHPFLQIDRQTVGWIRDRVRIDLRELEGALDELEADPTAIRTGTGDWFEGLAPGFLANGLKPSGSLTLEDWLDGQRAALEGRLAQARRLLLEVSLSRSDFDSALTLSIALMAADPLDEEACRHSMRLLARAGRRAEALACFESCRKALDEDLGIEPEDETMDLAASLREGSATSVTQPAPGRLAARARRLLLDRLERFWIEQVLETAIPPGGSFQILEQSRPEWVSSPWSVLGVLPRASPGGLLPAENSPLARFEELGSAMLIVGAPGGGKTFRLLELAREAATVARADEESHLPVVLHLSTWSRETEDLARWVQSELRDRYHLPHGVTEAWLARGRLLLLLDGLDQLALEDRRACVRAINRSRLHTGLTAVAVCCRLDSYQELIDSGVRLEFESAVELQPLTPWQVDEYLADAPTGAGGESAALALAFSDDPAWRELLANPLMLSLASESTPTASVDISQPGLGDSGKTAEDLRGQVVGGYVRRMLDRGADGEPLKFSTHWLRGLARGMATQGMDLFQIERLQPSWLPSPKARWAYLLASRSAMAAAVGLLMLLVGAVVGVDRQAFLVILSTTGVAALFLLVIDGLRLRIDRRAPHWAVRAFIAMSVAAILAFGGVAIGQGLGQHAAFGPVFFALTFTSLLVWRPRQVLWRRDVVPVGALAWSVHRALRGFVGGALGGALFGIVLFAISAPSDPGFSFHRLAGPAIGPMVALGIVAAILSGLHEAPAREIRRSNVGMRVSLRSAVFGAFMMSFGLAFGLLVSFRLLQPLLETLGIRPFFALRHSAVAPSRNVALAIAALLGGYAFLWYGGLEALKHTVLRVCLWATGVLPLRLGPFLAWGAERGLLRHQATGTIFRHQAVQEWLARAEAESEES